MPNIINTSEILKQAKSYKKNLENQSEHRLEDIKEVRVRGDNALCKYTFINQENTILCSKHTYIVLTENSEYDENG